MLPALAAFFAALALVASVTLTPPAPPAPGERDASAAWLAHVGHATAPVLHPARAPRFTSPSATASLPSPPTILAAPRAWTLQRRAGAAHAQIVRERDLRSQAPRAPPPRRS